MRYLLRYRRMFAVVMALTFGGITVGLSPAQAKLITTAQVLSQEAVDADTPRARVNAFLERKEVRSRLAAYGLDPEMAKERVDNLTDGEVALMAERLDRMPAGGDVGTTLIVASLIVFLVLLATDIMGYTEVFPFVE